MLKNDEKSSKRQVSGMMKPDLNSNKSNIVDNGAKPAGNSLEEKKRLRKEKLEAWKKKREQEKIGKQLNQSNGELVRNDSSNENPVSNACGSKADVKKVSITKKPLIQNKLVLKKLDRHLGHKKRPRNLSSNSVFDDSSDVLTNSANGSKKFKTNMATVSNSENYSLDTFLASLEDTSARPVGTLVDEEGENEVREDGQSLFDIENDASSQNNVEDIIKKLESDTKSSQKKIVKVDHQSINYPPIKKDFYVEASEVANMTPEEVHILRLELDGIKVVGKNPPNPVVNWSHFGISARYLDALRNDFKFLKPTPIQAQSIPAILQGRDMIGIAKTGSGKSLSFILPLFRHIKHRKVSPHNRINNKNSLALILVPTRELAMQTLAVAKRLDSTFRSIAVFGGENISKQINSLMTGVDLVIATPGRLIDILSLKKMSLVDISFLVIDEADRMFDMGFQPQITAIIENIRPDCQKVLFSATFPVKLEKLARNILKHNTMEIKIGLKGVNSDITQKVEVFDDNEDKFNALLMILGQFFAANYSPDSDDIFARIKNKENNGTDKILIFTDRQESTDVLMKRLINKGYECDSLHGGKTQFERDRTIGNFKKLSMQNSILIATSIAARGLDVPSLKLVINYDCPNHIEDYIHRVGRTGRAGNKGLAISFLVKNQERSAFDIIKAFKLSKVEPPKILEDIASNYVAKIKSGKERVFSGFGGRGLEKLEAQRDENKQLIKSKYNREGGTQDDIPDSTANDDSRSKSIIAKLEEVSDFTVIEGAASDAPDAGAFHSKISVNDLPQDVRWKITNRQSIEKIIDSTSCSITTKGRYYKPDKGPIKDTDEPKLYVLVEGEKHQQVSTAVDQIKQNLIEAMKAHLAEDKNTTGRYTIV